VGSVLRTVALLATVLAVGVAVVGFELRYRASPPGQDRVGEEAPRPAATEGVAAPEPRPQPEDERFLWAEQDDRGTTIYGATPGGEATRVFADAGTAVVIHDLDLTTRLVATPEGRLFAYAKPRTLSEEDFFPRGQTVFRTEQHRTYVYELGVDDAVRKVAEVLGTQSPRRFVVSPGGGRIAYFNVEWVPDEAGVSRELHWIYVHDTGTGELVARVDAGLHGYDAFRGATWLDESRIYLWRLPQMEEHVADMAPATSLGPHVIDVTSGVATRLEPDAFLAMLDEEERGREDAAPECGGAIDASTLLCRTSAAGYGRDPACRGSVRDRRLHSFDLDEMRPTQRLTTGPTCIEQWSLSPSGAFAVGLEVRSDGTAVSGRGLYWVSTEASATDTSAVEAAAIAETESAEPLLYPIGWMRR